MGKKGRILGIALLVTALGAMVYTVLLSREPEPVWQGKPLSYWLAGYIPTSTNGVGDRALVDEAVRHIGTNAIPTLLRMLRKTDSTLKLKLLSLSRKQNFFKVPYKNTSTYYVEADYGFRALGPLASNAVPELIRIYDQALSPVSQETIAGVLGSIGPTAKAAVPSLVRELANTNQYVRNSAITALGQIHANPGLVVPALIKALSDPFTSNQAMAAWALKAYGRDALAAVPALVEVSKQQPAATLMPGRGPQVTPLSPSEMAGMALEKIDPETAARVLTNRSSGSRLLLQ